MSKTTKLPQKDIAEQKLFEEIEAGRKSAQEKGFMSASESKAALENKTEE